MASTTIFRLRFNRNYTTFVKTGRGIVKVDFSPITGTKTDKEEAPDSETGTEDNLTHEKSVTSKNKAIAYLLEKHGATFSQTSDIAAMKEEARNVYNIVFDNWQ